MIKILIVDDAKMMRLVIKNILKSIGSEKNIEFQVFEAESGADGLSKAGALNPDLIFMDLNMPVMDGFEASKLLKSDPRLKHIPIIVLTAIADQESVIRIARSGISGYLVKPPDKDKLFDKLRSIIDKENAAQRAAAAQQQKAKDALEDKEKVKPFDSDSLFGDIKFVDGHMVRKTNVDALTPGMTIGDEVADKNGNVLLKYGTVLNEKCIEKLKSYEIPHVFTIDQSV